MRSLAILLVLVAGGCGGSAAKTRAEGPGVAPARAIVAEVEETAHAVCGCRDGHCADAAVRRLSASLSRRAEVTLSIGEQWAVEQAVARLDHCRARLVSQGEQAARVAERWAHETCACLDAHCMAAAAERGAQELRRYGQAEANDAEVQRIVAASRRVRTCLRSAGITGQR
jgi:hypothetical protein